MLSIHDLAALEAFGRRRRIDRHHLKQLRNVFYKRQGNGDEATHALPPEHRRACAAEIAFYSLRLQARHDSEVDGASKLLFETAQGLLLETVILRIASGRTALCVSTQVGCAAHCAFCATGNMGLAQNLSASQILDQVIQANQMLKAERRRVRNVVFMGMGEPFHNEEALYQAIEILVSPRCFDLSPKHLLVSTVGIPGAMLRCASRFPQVGLALSLHSARQGIREQLIPLARRHSLAELREAVARTAAIQQQPVMIEYLLFENLNDTKADLQALVEFLSGLQVHINLIPYNSIEEASALEGTTPAKRQEFAAALRRAGFKVTLRYSLGADIAAACGQLVRRENREWLLMVR